MIDDHREFAASSNGDRWLLGRDQGSGVAYVLHQANQPSGGAKTRIEIIDFLNRGPIAPEHYALLVMIGTLVPKGANGIDQAAYSKADTSLSQAEPGKN